MTRFDVGTSTESAADPSFTSARAIIAAHPGICVLSIALAGLVIAAACGLLLAVQGVRVQLARAINALELSVYLEPQSSRADAEGLRVRIEATPNVAGARLRTREAALATLVGDGLPSLSANSNPLPDVWIVTLDRSHSASVSQPLSAWVAEMRRVLSALPGVESVRVDAAWVDLLDRCSSWIGRAMVMATWTISAVLLSSLLGLFFLTGRALSAGGKLANDRMQALATLGMTSGLISLGFAGAALVLLTVLTPALSAFWKPIVDSVGRSGHVILVVMGLAVVFMAALGHALGGSRR